MSFYIDCICFSVCLIRICSISQHGYIEDTMGEMPIRIFASLFSFAASVATCILQRMKSVGPTGFVTTLMTGKPEPKGSHSSFSSWARSREEDPKARPRGQQMVSPKDQ